MYVRDQQVSYLPLPVQCDQLQNINTTLVQIFDKIDTTQVSR